MFESNIARYSSLVRRLFSIKGEVPLGVDGLGVPTFPLLEGPAELSYLRGEMLAQGSQQQTGVAARFTFIYIDSPVKLARVERFHVFTSTSTPIRVQVGIDEPNNAIANNQQVGVRDTRLLPAVPSVRILSNTSAAILVTENFTEFNLIGAGPPQENIFQGPWVLGPRTGGMIIEMQVANLSLLLSTIWTERPFEQGER